MKEQIIEILNGYVFNVEDQTGAKLEVIEKDDFEKIAIEIETMLSNISKQPLKSK